MLGAIAGDIAGSTHEHRRVETRDFPLFTRGSVFTDDTVLTVATAHAILTDGDYGAAYHVFGNRHPHAGYGGKFRGRLRSRAPEPYNSWGNGSAMRVSPVGWAFDTEQDVLREAGRSAAVTHDQAAIAGSLAEAWHGGVPAELREESRARLSDDLLDVTDRFAARYMNALSENG